MRGGKKHGRELVLRGVSRKEVPSHLGTPAGSCKVPQDFHGPPNETFVVISDTFMASWRTRHTFSDAVRSRSRRDMYLMTPSEHLVGTLHESTEDA